MTETETRWTFVTRPSRRHNFTPTGFVGTWHEATDAGRAYLATLPEGSEVWTVTTGDTSVMVESGKRRPIGAAPRDMVRVRDHPWTECPGPECPFHKLDGAPITHTPDTPARQAMLASRAGRLSHSPQADDLCP